MTETIRKAIEAADVDSLRKLVESDTQLADAEVRFGENGRNAVPPLHYVCDVVFRKLATEAQGLAMADVLLRAGVDPDRAYAKSGDTFLIAAASLGVTSVGLRLVEDGVDVRCRGLFGATALHWSAYMGLDQLAGALIAAGAELELTDKRYESTPLQWALHSWSAGGGGSHDRVARAAAVLVQRGARVPADALDSLTQDSDALLRDALASR